MTTPSAFAALRPLPALLIAMVSGCMLLTACNRHEPAADTRGAEPAASADATRSAEQQTVLYYYDPMRPEVHFDKPGKSPFMDMELVPKYAATEAAKGPGTGVAVSATIVQNLGIRTASPTRGDVRPSVRVPARVVADARGQARLQSRVTGWVERLLVRAVGQSVSAGSIVAEIYSPELVQAQEELLLGAETAGPATERLRRFGIADRDIQAIRRAGKTSRRLPLRAPVSGVVTELGVREGSSISPETLIVDLSARSAVWIEAQLFPAQLASLGNSYSARFTLPGMPDREWRSDNGTLVAIADPVTQTLAVRFPIDDAGGLRARQRARCRNRRHAASRRAAGPGGGSDSNCARRSRGDGAWQEQLHADAGQAWRALRRSGRGHPGSVRDGSHRRFRPVPARCRSQPAVRAQAR